MLGREFSYELLQVVSPMDATNLQHALTKLIGSELLYQRGLPPQATYFYKHALVQETAYQSLLKSRRKQLHQQIAYVLAERFPETRETQPELLAHHYTEAGLNEQAIFYWQRAGERATQRSAYVEAINHLTKGLEVLKALPDTPERAAQELTLYLTLGPLLQITKGYGAPEIEQTYSRALALCQQVGETPLLFLAQTGLIEVYFHRREYHKARAQAEQLLRLGENARDPALLGAGHGWLAFPLYYLGELPAARAHFEQGLAQHDPQHPSPGSVGPLLQLAHVLWNLGYPDQALKKSQEALTLARELSPPFILAFALIFTAWLHSLRGEEWVAREQAETAVTLSREHEFPFWLGWATLVQSGALTAQGQGEAGSRQIHQGLETLRAIRSEVGWTDGCIS
jgi:predicted ATPase